MGKSLGKGEVESSILSHSTIIPKQKQSTYLLPSERTRAPIVQNEAGPRVPQRHISGTAPRPLSRLRKNLSAKAAEWARKHTPARAVEANLILTELALHAGAIDTIFEVTPDGRWSFRATGIGGIVVLEARGYGGPSLADETLSADIKAEVLRRDGRVCRYCGRLEGPFHIDHVVPKAKGGSDHLSNLAVACAPCNMSKGARDLEEWMEWKRAALAPPPPAPVSSGPGSDAACYDAGGGG